MKLNDKDRAAFKSMINSNRENIDIEMTSIVVKLANDFGTAVRDSFTPYLNKGRFKGKKKEFVDIITSLLAMIYTREISGLASANFGDTGDLIDQVNIKISLSIALNEYKKDNPGLFEDH